MPKNISVKENKMKIAKTNRGRTILLLLAVSLLYCCGPGKPRLVYEGTLKTVTDHPSISDMFRSMEIEFSDGHVENLTGAPFCKLFPERWTIGAKVKLLTDRYSYYFKENE